MSYTTRCSINVSGSVSYPASNSGGSVSYSRTVEVDVTVDTAPFDSSVAVCSGNVGNLAMSLNEASSMISSAKAESANRISDSMSKGFVGLILNEIRQKMVELTALIPSKLQELKALAANCRQKHEQMTKDYERITSRYSALFSSLDQNLHASLLELDRPVFSITSSAGDVIFTEGVLNRFVSEGLYAGNEQVNNALLLEVANLKASASGIISTTARNIGYNQELNRKLSGVVVDYSCPAVEKVYVPAVVMTTADDEVFCSVPEECPDDVNVIGTVADAVHGGALSLGKQTSAETANVEKFLQKKVSAFLQERGNDEYSARVADNLMRLWTSVRSGLCNAD